MPRVRRIKERSSGFSLSYNHETFLTQENLTLLKKYDIIYI